MKESVLASTAHDLEIQRKAQAGVAQLVEHQPSKLRVAGSNLVSRSIFQQVQCLAGVFGEKSIKNIPVLV
jgi:hypothetical protein